MCSITPAECKIVFNELDIELGEVGSVLNQEQRELNHSSASYTILNPYVPLLAPHHSHFKLHQICVLGQFSVCIVILSMVTPLLALNLYQQPISSVRAVSYTHLTLPTNREV